MRLTNHFTLDELVASQTAARRNIDNTPPAGLANNLLHLAQGLEMIRMLLGAPILISSGYRCPELNALVGGAKNSQHMQGKAADFICPGFGTPEQIVAAIVRAKLPFDQAIVEFGQWVHVSFSEQPRHQAFVIGAKDGLA